MPGLIDRAGLYRGRFVESGVSATKSGLPQFCGRLVADQRYIGPDETELLAHFGLTEAGWADWSGYEQEMTGYFCLVSHKGEPIFHFKDLQEALGWDGSSFKALGAGDYSNTLVAFNVEEREKQTKNPDGVYVGTGEMRLEITGVRGPDGTFDGPGLRTLDAADLQNLDAKFANALTKKTAAPVTAAKAPPKPAAGKAPTAAGPKPTAAPVAAKPAVTTVKPAGPATPKPTGSSAPKAPKAPAKPLSKAVAAPSIANATADELDAALAADTGGLAPCSYGDAWNHVQANKGTASDDAAANAWVAASNKIGPGKDESTLTPEQNAQIATATLATLAATVNA